jgi:hypothetical protein
LCVGAENIRLDRVAALELGDVDERGVGGHVASSMDVGRRELCVSVTTMPPDLSRATPICVEPEPAGVGDAADRDEGALDLDGLAVRCPSRSHTT